MSTATDLIDAIKAVADSRDIPGAVGLQTPGDKVEYKGSELNPGSAWGDNKTMQIMVEGIADYLDTIGVPEVGTIKSKVNELIGSFNQLRQDFIDGGGSTSSSAVDQIP